MNIENVNCESILENANELDLKLTGNGDITNELPQKDLAIGNTYSSIDDKVIETDNFTNNHFEEQTEQIQYNSVNHSAFEENSEKELAKSNGLVEKKDNEKKDLTRTEVLEDEAESERPCENPINQVEIENFEDEPSFTEFSESETQMEDTSRSDSDSEQEILDDLKEKSINVDSSSQKNSPKSNNHKNHFTNSDDDFQYDTKHLLDVKEVKVLHECSLCEYSTTHQGILQKHISTKHKGRKIWKCKHCIKKFTSKDALHRHVYKDHTKRSRKCPFCLCILVCSGKIMKNHIADMHASERLPPVCLDRRKLEVDGLTRRGNRGMYRCKKCTYSNRCLNTMLSHAKMHTRKHVLKCLYCHYLTNQQKLYVTHLSNAHKLAKKINICSKCFFQSDDHEEYVSHCRQPHSYHYCDICDFKTYNVENFYVHLDKHACEKSSSEKILENQEDFIQNFEKFKGDKEVGVTQSGILGLNGISNELVTECLDIDVQEKQEDNTNSKFGKRDCPNAEHRLKGRKGFKEFYTQIEIDGVTMFSCLKCEFVSNFSSNYEICEHLVNEHSCSKTSKRRNSTEDTNALEFVHVESDNNPANRYVIEPRTTHHQKQKNDEKNLSFTCQECDWVAPTLHKKLIHDKKIHNVENFKCPTCSFETNDELALIDHYKSHSDSKIDILCCPFCEKEMENEGSLKSHVDIEHLNLMEESEQNISENIKQKVLDDDLQESGDEASSTKQVELEKLSHCNICSFSTLDRSILESHKKGHVILTCPRCFIDQFSSEKEFWEHVDRHCPQCRFYSNDPKKLKLHILTHVPKYKRRRVEPSKRLRHPPNAKTAENAEILYDSDTNDIDPEDLQVEEIRIIFEDSSEADDSSEFYSYENEGTMESNDQDESPALLRVKRKRMRKKAIVNSDITNALCENSDNEADEKIKGKPVRIIKLVQFQCFDCLNIYKTRYTLIDHRKRMHGLKKPHSCTYCMEIFEAYNLLKSHYYRNHKVSFHYRGAIFKCPLCEFNSIYLKKTHRHVEDTHQKRVVGFQRGTVV